MVLCAQKQSFTDLQFLLGGGGSMKLPPLPYLVSGMAALKPVRSPHPCFKHLCGLTCVCLRGVRDVAASC